MPSFDELTSEFLDAEFAESPVRASGLGLTRYDELLDDLSEAAFERRRRADAAWLERFRRRGRACARASTSRIDRDLVVSALRGRQIIEDFEVWRRQPDVYLNPGMTGIFSLFLHRLRPIEELVDAAVARMRLIPANLEDGKRNLRPEMVPGDLPRPGRQPGARRRSLRARDPAGADGRRRAAREAGRGGGSDGDRRTTATSRSWRRCARRRPATTRSARSATRPCCGRRSCSASALGSCRERGQAAYDELAMELTRCARELRGTDDWKAVLDELNEDHPRTPEEMRSRLRGVDREGARPTCASIGWSRFPEGEECAVVPSPPFQRPVLAVASYMSPAAVQRQDARPLLRAVPARRRLGGRDPEAARVELVSGHPDDRRPRGVPGPPLAPRHVEGEPEPAAPGVPHAVLQRGLGALRRADDARAGLLHRPAARDEPVRGNDLPRRADRRRHQPPHGRDDLGRGGHVHDQRGPA